MYQKKRRGRHRKSSAEILLQYCSQLHADDQVDPRDYFREGRKSNQRKTQQLCKQVGHALALSMGELGDEDLQGLQVMSVQPAPNASQLLVILDMQLDAMHPLEQVLAATASVREKLSAVEGRLRTTVASAIHRKRAPRLLYQVFCTSSTFERQAADSSGSS